MFMQIQIFMNITIEIENKIKINFISFKYHNVISFFKYFMSIRHMHSNKFLYIINFP